MTFTLHSVKCLVPPESPKILTNSLTTKVVMSSKSLSTLVFVSDDVLMCRLETIFCYCKFSHKHFCIYHRLKRYGMFGGRNASDASVPLNLSTFLSPHCLATAESLCIENSIVLLHVYRVHFYISARILVSQLLSSPSQVL